MLVLSRQYNESVFIGGSADCVIRAGSPLEIIVVEIRGSGRQGKVRFGIVAPAEIPVHRKEVWESIQRENAREQRAIQDTLNLKHKGE